MNPCQHRDRYDAQIDFANWVFCEALPLWWQHGVDRIGGGFYDALSVALLPTSDTKRLRVQARQIFVFAQAGCLGWQGPWREAMVHGAAFIIAKLCRDDGLFRPVPLEAGEDRTAGLYDQAFALLALACLHHHDPGGSWQGIAERLLERLEARHGDLWTEPGEQGPTISTNSLMHLFEALLAWCAAGPCGRFEQHARKIREAISRWLLQSSDGKLAEILDPVSGQPTASANRGFWMPGHHYEWAFLLHCSERLLGGNVLAITRRLVAVAERHGLHSGRVTLSQYLDGRTLDPRSRLWGQTERLRAALFCSEAFGESQEAAVASSRSVVADFLSATPAGFWYDECDVSSVKVRGPAPASSFYHVIGALAHLPEVGGDHLMNGGLPS